MIACGASDNLFHLPIAFFSQSVNRSALQSFIKQFSVWPPLSWSYALKICPLITLFGNLKENCTEIVQSGCIVYGQSYISSLLLLFICVSCITSLFFLKCHIVFYFQCTIHCRSLKSQATALLYLLTSSLFAVSQSLFYLLYLSLLCLGPWLVPLPSLTLPLFSPTVLFSFCFLLYLLSSLFYLTSTSLYPLCLFPSLFLFYTPMSIFSGSPPCLSPQLLPLSISLSLLFSFPLSPIRFSYLLSYTHPIFLFSLCSTLFPLSELFSTV